MNIHIPYPATYSNYFMCENPVLPFDLNTWYVHNVYILKDIYMLFIRNRTSAANKENKIKSISSKIILMMMMMVAKGPES